MRLRIRFQDRYFVLAVPALSLDCPPIVALFPPSMRSSYDEKGLQRPRGLAKLAIPSGDQFRRQAVSTNEKCAELSLIEELYIDFILDKSEKVQY